MENKTIKIIVQGGVVVDVKNIPDGYEVQIIDDDIEGHDVYNETINDPPDNINGRPYKGRL